MGRPRTKHCRSCGRHIDEVGPLSRNRRLCEACGISRQTAAIESISYGQGPAYDRYVDGIARYASTLHRAADSAATNPAPSSTDTQNRNR